MALKLKEVRPVLPADEPTPPTPEHKKPAKRRKDKPRETAKTTAPLAAAGEELPEIESRTPQRRRRQTSLTLLPQLIDRLQALADELAEQGSRRASFAQLVGATVFFAVPREPEEARTAALRWARLRAGTTDPFEGARGREINVRLDEALVDELDTLARQLKRDGILHGRSVLINAAVHFNGPRDAQAARDLLARYELAQLEASEAA